MITQEYPKPEPNVTAKDLDQALKKQLKAFHSDMQKSHKILLASMRDAMRDELQEIVEDIKDPVQRRGLGMNQSEDDYQHIGSVSRASWRKNSVWLSPFKKMNAKINDADELAAEPQVSRQTTPVMQASVPETVAVECAFREQAINDNEIPTSAREIKQIRNEVESIKPGDLLEEQVGEADDKKAGVRQLVQRQSLRRTAVQQYEPLLPSSPQELMGDEITRRNNIAAFDWRTAILYDPKLEGCIVCLVLLNSIWIGVELDYKLSVSEDRPYFFNWIKVLFCAVFTVELLFRICVLRLEFFDPREAQWVWNYFDFFLVLSQLLEIIFEFAEFHKNVNVSWLRILRILRIVRLTRVVRAVRFVEGLRTLIRCMLRGMQATGWISLFLVGQVYTCSLAFAEVVHELRMKAPDELAKRAELDLMFGSLRSTMGTLIKSIAGGISWDIAMSPLMEISLPLALAFGTYVCFSIFVVLNVIMGFYVNTSVMCADEDSKKNLRDHVADIFVQDGEHRLDAVDEGTFTERVTAPEMISYFESIDLQIDEAEGLFKLLDIDGNGLLDPIECVSALVRMQGSAKALDLRILMFMFARGHEWNTSHVSKLERKIAHIHDMLRLQQNENAGLQSPPESPLSPSAANDARASFSPQAND